MSNKQINFPPSRWVEVVEVELKSWAKATITKTTEYTTIMTKALEIK